MASTGKQNSTVIDEIPKGPMERACHEREAPIKQHQRVNVADMAFGCTWISTVSLFDAMANLAFIVVTCVACPTTFLPDLGTCLNLTKTKYLDLAMRTPQHPPDGPSRMSTLERRSHDNKCATHTANMTGLVSITLTVLRLTPCQWSPG